MPKTALKTKPSGSETHSHSTSTRRVTALSAVLAIALVAAVLISAGSGQLGIPPHEVLGSILHKIGINWLPQPSHPAGDSTLWTIRFPRVAMAALVGAALALSGLVMQAIFSNPLAEPGVIGVSSGAAVGAGIAIVTGINIFGDWTVAVFAFLAGLVATLLVYAVSRQGGRTEVVTLVLTGIAVNAVAGAGITLLTFLGDTQSREQIVFWQLGSMAGSRWQQSGIILPALLLGLVVIYAASHKLDLLSLGERNARYLGVNVEMLRLTMIIIVALLTGVAVAFTGIISFVGLVIPHLMRMILGPAHGPLIITSTLGGALLLTIADLAARNTVPNSDMPIGMLTSLVGGPFFFWLLRKTRRRAGGWG